jgi:thymidylate kinase
LVALYGPDGVGKSTQIEIISNNLRKEGYKVKTIWIRAPHTLAFIISTVLVKLGFSVNDVNPYGKIKKLPDVDSNFIVKNIWATIEFISVLPLILIKVVIPIILGYAIIADRYLLDTIVSVAYYIKDIDFVNGKIARILMLLIPRNSILIHLDADYDTLLIRRGKNVESYEFIDFQKKAYARLSKNITSNYIDTSKISIDETSQIIDKLIKQYLASNTSIR